MKPPYKKGKGMVLSPHRLQSEAEMKRNGRMSTVTKHQEESNKRVLRHSPVLANLQTFLESPLPWEKKDDTDSSLRKDQNVAPNPAKPKRP